MVEQDSTVSDARERILAAAASAFAAHGAAGTSIRAVARAAGVSPALVMHHFGSKDGLREACDEAVLDAVTQRKLAYTSQAGPDFSPAAIHEYLTSGGSPEHLRYLTRMILDGTDAGEHLFRSIVERTESVLREGWPGLRLHEVADPRATAVLLSLHALAPLLLAGPAGRALGLPDGGGADADAADPAAILDRLSGPLMSLYTQGLITLQE